MQEYLNLKQGQFHALRRARIGAGIGVGIGVDSIYIELALAGPFAYEQSLQSVYSRNPIGELSVRWSKLHDAKESFLKNLMAFGMEPRVVKI